jgi:hypothetical protein
MNGTAQECTGAADGTQLTLGDSTVVSSVYIHDLSQTFIATAGCAIDLYGAGPLTINVNTGPYGLESVQYGLTATVTTGPGSVTIDNIGSVTSGAMHAAIYGETRGGGAVEITTNGTLGGGYYGIWSRTSNVSGTAGEISIVSNGGDIHGTWYGIRVDTTAASHVAINGGSVYGGTGGIYFSASGPAIIDNYGTVNGASYAITTDAGDDTINNYGTVQGNVFMGSGADVFTNYQSGTVYSGSDLQAETFVNRGILSPGGPSYAQTTQIHGDIQQTSTGRYVVDVVEIASTVFADRIDVDGNATLAGTVVVQRSGDIGASGSIVIASVVNGDLTNNLGAVRRSGGYKYSLSATYGATDYLTLNWLLAPGGVVETVNGNGTVAPGQQAVASHLDRMAESGGGSAAFEDMVNDVADMSSAQAVQAVERLSPEHFAQRATDTSQSNLAFMNAAMSCPTLATNPGFIQEGQCYWAKVEGRHLGWDKTDRNIGGDEAAWTTSGGVQVALRDAWRLGFAGAYEHSNVSTNNGAATETDRGQGAIILKNRWNTVSLAAAAFAGYAWSDTRRLIGFSGLGTAESDHESWFAGSQVRLSQLFEQAGGWYVKPLVDFNATRLATESFREHGGGAAALAVDGDATWILAASPALEIGAQVQVGGLVLRPFARAGATFFQDAVYETTASFIAAPGQSFTIESEFDRVYFDVAAGVDVLNAAGVDVKLTYDGRFSEHSEMHAGGIKAALPF